MRIGFRQWGLAQGRLFPAFYAIPGPHARSVPWAPDGPTRFRCVSRICTKPGFTCLCGLYVHAHLQNVSQRTNNGRYELVVGAAKVWGRYVLYGNETYTEGARYEIALPVAFVKPYTVLAQRELQWVADRLGAVIVADRDALLELAAGLGRPLVDGPAPWWEQL